MCCNVSTLKLCILLSALIWIYIHLYLTYILLTTDRLTRTDKYCFTCLALSSDLSVNKQVYVRLQCYKMPEDPSRCQHRLNEKNKHAFNAVRAQNTQKNITLH